MHWFDSIWMLFASILFGSLCGVTASHFLTRVDETEDVKRHASKPFLPDIKTILHNDNIRRMIIGRCCLNLCAMMSLTMYVLPLKKGYGVSDGAALIFALVVYIGKSMTGLAFGNIIKSMGSRTALLACSLGYIVTAPLWIAAPANFYFIYVFLICVILGASDAISENGKGLYLLECVPERLQASVSVLVSLTDGALMGLLAIGLNALLLKYGDYLAGDDCPALNKYRIYFLLALPILALAFYGVVRMKPMKKQ